MSQLKSFNVSNEIMRAQKNGHAGSTLARVVWKKQFTSASHASSSAQADDPVHTDISDESQGCGGCPAFAGHDGQRIDQQTPLLKSITSPQSSRVSTQPTLGRSSSGGWLRARALEDRRSNPVQDPASSGGYRNSPSCAQPERQTIITEELFCHLIAWRGPPGCSPAASSIRASILMTL